MLHKQAPIETKPLVIEEVHTPVVWANEIRIRIHACGVCRTDLHIVEGDLPMKRNPTIPGHQIVGAVTEIGNGVTEYKIGDRVGVAWVNQVCGVCNFCITGRENLCDSIQYTGWTTSGGFAEEIVVPVGTSYPIPKQYDDLNAAPLLCAGIIGYRALRLTGIDQWKGARVGLYGFGSAGHICLQILKDWGADVYVSTRDKKKHQALAEQMGAHWVGGEGDIPPDKLDAAIIFAPSGKVVPIALQGLNKGGTIVLGGIYMSDIPSLKYELIYDERIIRSVTNYTRSDGELFLKEAAKIGIKPEIEVFSMETANEALIALKNDAIQGSGVLEIQ